MPQVHKHGRAERPGVVQICRFAAVHLRNVAGVQRRIHGRRGALVAAEGPHADVHSLGVADVVIQPDTETVVGLLARRCESIVVQAAAPRHGGTVRHRNHRQNRFRDGRDQLSRNMAAVAPEQPGAFPESPARVEHLRTARVVHQVNASLIGRLSEVAGPFKRSRNAVERQRCPTRSAGNTRCPRKRRSCCVRRRRRG